MKNIIVIALVLLFSLQVTGCETLKGLGKDLSSLGEKIDEESKE
ncbi:MAG: entericidin EcnAB [Chromatiales bacterium]|nr:entericidin EcnAB [Chromatiales bacterium]